MRLIEGVFSRNTMIRKAHSKREDGKFGEQMASFFLTKNGYNILCRNYTVSGGEIDIIASKGEYICFIEVKLRKKSSGEAAREAVDSQKLGHIQKAMNCFFEEFCDNIYISSLKPRIDVIEIYTTCGKNPEFNHIIGIDI